MVEGLYLFWYLCILITTGRLELTLDLNEMGSMGIKTLHLLDMFTCIF